MDIIGTWRIRGRLNGRARYSGNVTLSPGPRRGTVRLDADCTTDGDVHFVWKGRGRLDGSRLMVKLTMRIGHGRWRPGEAAYVSDADGARLQGTWALCRMRTFGGETLWRPGARSRPRAPGRPAPPKRMPSKYIHVPLVPQANDFSCGAASLAAVLYYWRDLEFGEGVLYRRLRTAVKNGTEPRRIAEAATRLGLHAEYATKVSPAKLWKGLERGDTVILDLQAWHDGNGRIDWKAEWDDGHYVVLVGRSRHHVFVMDPSTPAAYAWFPVEELEVRWHDTERGRRGHAGHDDPRFFQAIFIHGRGPLRSMPGPPIRMR